MRQGVVIAGNWKMHKNSREAIEFLDRFVPAVVDSPRSIYLAVPFTLLSLVSNRAAGTNLVIGAQNMHDAVQGAFTGEVSSLMLLDAGARFVILGHSERRCVFNETSEFINRKVKRAIADGIQPVVCVGETQTERERGLTDKILKNQLLESLSGVQSGQFSKILIAYEPVWAIGTGLNATPEQAQKAHLYIREIIQDHWGHDVAKSVSLLYGGSVKPDNARDIMEQEDVDGVLVGGASLDPDAFSQIVRSALKK